MGANVRRARLSDLEQIVDIYNHYVINTAITFDIDPYSVETRRGWFDQFGDAGPHQLLVAEFQGDILGYAGTMPFRQKAAYAQSVETTVYLRNDAGGQGLGSKLYEALFAALEGAPVHRLLAGMTVPNQASDALHAKHGFEPCGLFREVGFKFDKYWDVQWYDRVL
ncbi:Phosphinothricin N-acetyltransferase [Candidatus Phaeomarinobacter ectocarpi]|uniref:Phosphinothricin N-acetyltransferase n=1 Tax=Candidatus Phaeomarinibacter ectocarpi TaxID=1458461 RepID=X5MAL8_9HYPH|nr:GNAT family N-acetyltransferase [Candidatus Phaeomarinobacter ectocarpi]CDO60958.1 Phosphinothricin N-acetyltransferase [Candidatus Phaeomarinobacter ectocarpi]